LFSASAPASEKFACSTSLPPSGLLIRTGAFLFEGFSCFDVASCERLHQLRARDLVPVAIAAVAAIALIIVAWP
jgi:hypothetical protein